jgi:predicted kinase
MSRLIMCKGLPASGKSTWAKWYVANKKAVRVNRDDLRASLHGGQWSPKNEKAIKKIQMAIIEDALTSGRDVVVDDTNLHPSNEARYRQMARELGAEFIVQDFTHVDAETCITRDKHRGSVGENVIRKMHREFLVPAPEPQDRTLPFAVIFDMDGTLADMNGRNPYDESTCDQDLVNEAVAMMFRALAMDPFCRIIIMSGRDEGRGRAPTERWLQKHDLVYDLLLMRPAGDTRKDAIIKRELYDAHVKGRYFVQAVFDDRDQVVRLWRDDLGLPTFQVAWGDF